MKKISITVLIIYLVSIGIQAQTMSLNQYEDSIKSAFNQLVQAKSDSGRIVINSKIDKLFGEVLSSDASFVYPFDSLKNISKLRSEDNFVRIINWNIPTNNGTYKYFGYIQFKSKKEKMQLFRLEDNSESIENPEFKELTDKTWYGALYYKILTKKAGKTIYYTVLGWDGNNDFTNKKVVETFYFNNKKLVFGPPIFKMEKTIQNRLVFEFSEQAKMLLRYDEKVKMVVFDHLVPTQKKFEGQFMYYGPDMSQDGLIFEDGLWQFKPNLDLRNLENPKVKEFEKSF